MNKPVAGDGTVGKALEILDLVASFDRPVRFGELLDSCDYPKATLYRFLQTLVSQQMLSYEDRDGCYSLGLRLIRLAHSAWSNASLAPIARPHLEHLAQQTGESVHLAQIDSGQVLFIDKIHASDRFETQARAGQVAPAYCTGVGKAMLAFMAPRRLDLALKQQAWMAYTPATHTSPDSLRAELARIREAGIAYDREEHEAGIISIAAPILTTSGRVIGALSVATSTAGHSLSGLSDFRADLLGAAEKIGEDATNWQFPA